ncbi:MAG: DNA polymerase [Gemmataceae bacterium]|nr:DNA polymerase [Gemmataceae bacterium]
MPLRYLFVDMNAFFASVEQQDDKSLRGRPVAVIPTKAETTFCIAASYEARAFGVKTGTPVWQARKLCPGLITREADHDRYVVVHHRILDAVGSVLPVGRVMSVDELSCKLLGDERHPDRAIELARRVKAAIYDRAGEWMRCSVGAGPNELLAKVAADLHKPDGLTVLRDDDLAADLGRLKPTDFPGVGPRMERRLKLHGIFTAAQLVAAPAKTLAAVWGSRVLGEKWFRVLRGEDVPEKPTKRHTVSHSHVLPPELRTDDGALGVLVRLTHKAAARLRKEGYWAGGVSVGVDWKGEAGAAPAPAGWGKAGWGAGCRLAHCQDTPSFLRAVGHLWGKRPKDGAAGVPFKVGMALVDLVPAAGATPSLFEADRRAAGLSHAMDGVNAEFGASVVYFGTMWGLRDAAPNRIAFGRIPDLSRAVS